MKIGVKFFLIFTVIAIFTISITYFIASISITKIVFNQTEQTLSSSLYTNYSVLRNLFDSLPADLAAEAEIRDLYRLVSENNAAEIEKNAEQVISFGKFDYILISKEGVPVIQKAVYPDIDSTIPVSSLNLNQAEPFITRNGLLVLARITSQNSGINIIGGRLIDEVFLEKLYHENVNVILYWNNEVFLSTNSIFTEPLPGNKERLVLTDHFNPSVTFQLNWIDRVYKLKYHPVYLSDNNSLVIATMASTLYEDRVFTETVWNLFIFLVIFLAALMVISYYISYNIVEPFHSLAYGISKKDKKSIRELLKRKDEIGELANEFWTIMEDLLNQQEQKEKINSLIAHDLKTPLVAIIRSMDSLKDQDNINKEQQKFLVGLILKHCSQSLELINNLLKVQKYEMGKMNLFMSEENFNILVDDCVQGLKPIADDKDIKLEIVLDPRISKTLLDRTELSRVITNLLSNAIKYTDEGSIKVMSRMTKEGYELRITDTGRGIPVYEQNKIFNFYKTSSTNGSEHKDKDDQDISTGLGLYLCKQIVEAHGGEIGFESYRNKGSTFYFSIPVR